MNMAEAMFSSTMYQKVEFVEIMTTAFLMETSAV